jgi:hypothetical protein
MKRKSLPILAFLLGLWLLALPTAPLHSFRFTWSASPVATIAAALNGGGTTSNIDTTGADTLFAKVCRLTGDTPTFSDNGAGGTPNTWTSIRAQADGGGGGLVSGELFRSGTPASVGTGHNFSLSGGTFAAVVVSARAGGATSSIDDQENSAGCASGSTCQPGSITPSVPDTIVITGVVSSDGTDPDSINGGFSIDAHISSTGSNFGCGLGSLVQTTATAANPTWTLSGSATYVASTIASFKTTAGGGGAAPCRLTLLGVGCEFASVLEDVERGKVLRPIVRAWNRPATTKGLRKAA